MIPCDSALIGRVLFPWAGPCKDVAFHAVSARLMHRFAASPAANTCVLNAMQILARPVPKTIASLWVCGIANKWHLDVHTYGWDLIVLFYLLHYIIFIFILFILLIGLFYYLC